SIGAAARRDPLALRTDSHVRLRHTAIPSDARATLGARIVLGRTGFSRRLRRKGAGLSAPWLARRYLRGGARRHGDGGRRQTWSLLDAALPRRTLPCSGTAGRATLDRAGR